MDRYDEFKEAISNEIYSMGNIDEETSPVNYGYVLGLKMALSWAAVLREKEKDTKEEERVDSCKKAKWVDVSMVAPWNYQCSACGMRENAKSLHCCNCGAEMENA